MSKSVKMIVGVVAAVAIPFAAPALASAMIGSATVGGAITGAGTALGLGTAGTLTATSALTGSALGALSAAATGGDVGRGALFGGLGGGLGGLAKAGQAAQAAQAANTATTGTSSALTSAPVAGVNTIAPAGANAAQLGSVGGVLPEAGALANLGATSGAVPGVVAEAAAVPGAVAGAAPVAGVQPAATAGTWGQRFKAGLQDSWNQFTAPENISNMALEGGKYIAGSLAAGDAMSSQQQALLRAQEAELKRAQEANEAAYNTRRDEALKLINEANYFDPNYMGLQRARDAQLQGARAKRAGLRGLDTPARQAEGRRYDLGTARATGSAYDEGYQTGITSRNQTRAAGLAALPAGYNMTTSNYSTLAQAYDDADRRRQERATDIGRLFGDFSGKRRAEERGA